MTNMKSIPALSFKCACALNTTSNESAVTFISSRVNYVHMKTSCTGIRNYGTPEHWQNTGGTTELWQSNQNTTEELNM